MFHLKLTSIGPEVSEEKSFSESVNGRRRTTTLNGQRIIGLL